MVRSAIGAAALALAMWAAPASAQATRTWVSGVGDDVNPCSRTAPCKTFAGAISKTASGGEINCMDPGGYGAVTITKSITIACDTVPAGVIVISGSNGITVNGTERDVVVLSGLTLQGQGTGGTGILVYRGTVVVRNVTISGFQTPISKAIAVDPNGTGQAILADSRLINNRLAVSGKVISAGDNLLAANTADGSFADTIAYK